jgi:hypothetical protein
MSCTQWDRSRGGPSTYVNPDNRPQASTDSLFTRYRSWNPLQAFLPLACTANLAKNLAAVAASATRAPIYRTFALQASTLGRRSRPHCLRC